MQNSFVTLPVNESSPTRETANVRREIRQECNDTYNRLHSIAEDAVFVSQIARLYPAFKVYGMLPPKIFPEDPYLWLCVLPM